MKFPLFFLRAQPSYICLITVVSLQCVGQFIFSLIRVLFSPTDHSPHLPSGCSASRSIPSTPLGSAFSGSAFSSQPSSQPPLQLNAGPSTFSPRLSLARFDNGEDSEGSYKTDDGSFDHSDSESEARLSHDEVISKFVSKLLANSNCRLHIICKVQRSQGCP